MPAYVTLAQLRAALPAEITAQLLDDNNTGAPDANSWPFIATAVQTEIDGKLGQRYPVPLDPVPPIIANAAFVLAAELLYQRRGYHGDQNPWAARAEGIRGSLGQAHGSAGLLDLIATGAQPLTPEIVRKQPSASVITETARTHSCAGRMAI